MKNDCFKCCTKNPNDTSQKIKRPPISLSELSVEFCCRHPVFFFFTSSLPLFRLTDWSVHFQGTSQLINEFIETISVFIELCKNVKTFSMTCSQQSFLCFIVFVNQTAGRRRVTLTADRTIIPLGSRVTLTCSVDDPAGFEYQWFRQTSDYSVKTPLQTENVDESSRVISQGGKYTCRGLRREPYVVTPDSNEVVIEETGEFSIF